MMNFKMDSKLIEDVFIQIQSRSMSDPPFPDIDFKNKMIWVRTTLKLFLDPPSAIGVGKDGEPRLIITKIVNTDFKSYAGTKIIGPFHKVKLIHFCVG